jgi:DNA-binding transcriptional LysR family regulator
VDLLLPPGTAPRARTLPVTFLRQRRLVLLQPGSAFRRHVEAVLAREGIRPQAAVEVGNLSLVRRFVAAGLGVAPVPAVAFAGEAGRAPRVDVRRLRGFSPVAYVRLVRAGAPLGAPVRQFLELLQREARRPG